MGFDQTVSDRALLKLGQQIIADPEYAGHDWQGIAVVIQIEPRRRVFGYLYLPNGAWTAAAPALRPTINNARALADAMRADGKAGWKTCLIQIARPGPKMKAEFEYDHPARWDITPANLAERIQQLRPAETTKSVPWERRRIH